MNKWWKAALAVLAGLAVLAVALVFLGLQLAERRMARRVEVPVQPVALASDAVGLERGRYLFASRGCAECHGANGAGKVFAEDGKGLLLKGPNITTGAGGATARYRPEDWVRTIRHGVAPDGRPLRIMPS